MEKLRPFRGAGVTGSCSPQGTAASGTRPANYLDPAVSVGAPQSQKRLVTAKPALAWQNDAFRRVDRATALPWRRILVIPVDGFRYRRIENQCGGNRNRAGAGSARTKWFT